MGGEKIPGHKRAEDQESLVGPINRNRNRKFGTFSYHPIYAEIAYSVLSESDTAATKDHVCHALSCSYPTMLSWMKKFPEFKFAIESGLRMGAHKWREKIASYAFSPTSEVNNGLIKLLSSNVYGIKEEAPPVVVINTITDADPADVLKSRGIPIPIIATKDIDDETD